MKKEKMVVEHTSDGVVAKLVAETQDTPVQAANRKLIAQEWKSYVDSLAPLGESMFDLISTPGDSQAREELYRMIYSTISQAFFGLVYADPKYPDFWPNWNQAYNMIIPNPDDVYYMCPIDDDGIYRISGFRGKVHIVSLVIGSGEFLPYGRNNFGPTLADYHLDRDVHLNDDGSFEVVLSAERPKDYQGDWWPLPPKATFINVRQRSYDWMQEDARLAIERLDTPTIKPRPTGAEIADGLKQIATWAENVTKLSIGWCDAFAKLGLINKVHLRDLSGSGGVKGQQYVEGVFDIPPDEALILETEVPETCLYWMFHLANELSVSIDPLNRQSSLNGHTAKCDADGKLRIVISAEDPGVPNWLDTGGYRRGIIYGRWWECSSYPLPTVTKVKFADLRRHLPTDTPVVSAEARDAALRLRRKGAQLRKRW